MSCGCEKPQRVSSWTPIPPFNAPTVANIGNGHSSHEPLPGENIDCYMQRAPVNNQEPTDDSKKIPNKIENTSLTSDLDGNVNEQFKLTDTSTAVASSWSIWTDDSSGAVPGLTFDDNTGLLKGQVPEENRGKNYKVEIKAFDASGELIDSRQFNFYPKTKKQGEDITFIFPFTPNGVITSSFGPRVPPINGATHVHQGIDIAIPGGKLGDIIAAADGVVTRDGPARGFGHWVWVEHRNSNNELVATTVYAHMNSSYVTVGQKLSAGQKIAKEGDGGIGTGAHLHFELHKGSYGHPVDPVPYLNGTMSIADKSAAVSSSTSAPHTVTNNNTAMSAGESKNLQCPKELPSQYGTKQPNKLNDSPSAKILGGQSKEPNPNDITSPLPLQTDPKKAATQAAIRKALSEDPRLTDSEKNNLEFVAKIESNYNATAKNPTSSATGVFQMTNATADAYYAKIGYPNPTLEQREDPYLATKAQIAFYEDEQKPYYDNFKNSGGTTLGGVVLSPDLQARYANLSEGEFTYGLLHHDGIGNAQRGRDMQGVDYYRRQIALLS